MVLLDAGERVQRFLLGEGRRDLDAPRRLSLSGRRVAARRALGLNARAERPLWFNRRPAEGGAGGKHQANA